MINQLGQLGIETIVCVDDCFENTVAALMIGDKLPGIEIETYSNSEQIIPQIPKRYQEIGLIVTDLQMDGMEAGIRVYEEALRYHVPCVIATGGFLHGGMPKIKTFPVEADIPDRMEKNDSDCWYRIVEASVNEMLGKEATLLKCLHTVQKAGTRVPDDFTAEYGAKLARGFLI